MNKSIYCFSIWNDRTCCTGYLFNYKHFNYNNSI